jgi:hypothetical protein
MIFTQQWLIDNAIFFVSFTIFLNDNYGNIHNVFDPSTKVAYHLCKTCGKRVQLGFEFSIMNFEAFTISLLQPTTINLTLSCSQNNLKHQNIISIVC